MSGFDFDPAAFIQPKRRQQQRAVPSEWVDGLDRILARQVPKIAEKARWEQVVTDARRLVERHGDHLVAARWSIENLFGFDPSEPDFFAGLAVAMKGADLISVTPDEATLKAGNVYVIHRPRMRSGCSMLWNFDETGGSR